MLTRKLMRSPLRICTYTIRAMLLIAMAIGAQGDDGEQASASSDAPEVTPALSLDLFETQRQQIETHIARTPDDRWTHGQRCVRLGDALSYHGVTDVAAASYIMALRELGITENTEGVAMRLGRSLAPLDSDTGGVEHAPEGPRFLPTWKGRRTPARAELEQAIAVYAAIESETSDEDMRGRALMATGRLYRAMNKWEHSTAAYLRCTETAKDTREAKTAYWEAAKNLKWTSDAGAAAEVLRRFVNDYPNDDRVALAKRRIEDLDAEARRGESWFRDPVQSLRDEIEFRKAVCDGPGVYRSVCSWLECRGQLAQLLDISRWASQQADWSNKDRVIAYANLSSALMSQEDCGQDAQVEAAQALAAIAGLADTDREAVAAAVRSSVILRNAEQYEAAQATLQRVQDPTQRSSRFELRLLPEVIRVHVQDCAHGSAPVAPSV